MQAGELVTSDVQAFESRVLVNGVQREILSWSVDREIANDLPAQVTGGSGVSQATGSIEWASKDVHDGSLNPWNPSTGWIPSEGDRVEIWAGDGITEWKQFTGVIDSTSGDIAGGIQSKIIDDIDKLSAVVDIPSLMTGMPPLTEGGAWRRVGMSSRYHQNSALRTAGFYSTPKPEWGCVLDIPLQSSMWPEIGSITTGSKRSDTGSSPASYGASWGTAMGDFTGSFKPSSAKSINTPLQITMMRAADHGSSGSTFAYVRVEYGSATKSVELNVQASLAYIRVNNVTITSVPCSGDTVCTLVHKGDVITLKTSQGQEMTVTSPTGASGNITNIVLAADANARVAGIQVSHPTTTAQEFKSLSFTPTARITTGGIHAANLILPAVTDSTARDLLDDIGSKTLRPMWIDELGVAQITASDILFTRSPSQQITTLDDVRSLSWSRDLLSVRSSVKTNYLHPVVNARTTPSITAWEGGGSNVLQSGESQDIFIEPGSDEDWVMADESFIIAGIHSLTRFNDGSSSVLAAVLTDGVNESWATQGTPPPVVFTVSKLGANKFVVKATAGTLPAGNQVELRTFSEDFTGSTGLWPMWRAKDMPILRANAVAKWTTLTRNPTVAGTHGPVLEHDCGPWLTSGGPDTTAVDALSSFLAEQVTNPAPVITGMGVGYDPRRQLGDVILVSSQNLMGVELTCLIVGISNQAGSNGYTQSLSVRVIKATSTFTTYGEFMDAWGDTADYGTLLTAWGAVSTYNEFANDPLKGTE